ncbi:glycosyltransferase [Streptomyces sp. NPDC093250]|uniref:glycosyltransferase n=1 Tax=Streptomyces sp. NPDC093250 TaxID=3366036 RepID=UPI003816675F
MAHPGTPQPQTVIPRGPHAAPPVLPEAHVPGADPLVLSGTVGPARADKLDTAFRKAREALAGRRIIDVNSTMNGGGVAEMLHRLQRYSRGAGLDARWFTMRGDPAFFALTKQLHHFLHGVNASGPPLDRAGTEHYAAVCEVNARALLRAIRPGDVVTLHDPQAAGLVAHLRLAGARVVWRCHIGTDHPNPYTDRAWAFLQPWLEMADAYVFSREQYVPGWLAGRRVAVIRPSIDPLSAKNRPLAPSTAAAILRRVGLRAPADRDDGPAIYRRGDGSVGRVRRNPTSLYSASPPPADAPLIVQVSRWDPLKDMASVLTSFAEADGSLDGAHLALVGPDVTGVTDDPEGGQVFAECVALWQRLPDRVRTRVHLACLPMADSEENAVIVNALQCSAAVVTQKSLAEGFGLTVTEAMWKGRAVVASAVGGIRDQIEHGVHGILLDDPRDSVSFAAHTSRLVGDHGLAGALGAGARRRVQENFLDDRQLLQQTSLYRKVARL